MDYFVFGNVDSRDYNVWIYPSDIDSAPQREYSEVVIAGRNGTLTIDNGRYENIDHVYQGIIFSDSVETDLINFRNAMVSQIDYQRLEDSIHTNEFYEARFMEIFAPVVAEGRSAVKFEIKFNRKPQRFLKDGEITYETYLTNRMTKTFIETEGTKNGITFTEPKKGTMSAAGTATGDAIMWLWNNLSMLLTDGKSYRLEGCQTGGGPDSYALHIYVNKDGNIVENIYDYGEGAEFTFDSSKGAYIIEVVVYEGATVDNVVFEPEINLIIDESEHLIGITSDGKGKIINPTQFDAKPLLIIKGRGTLAIGKYSLTITGTTWQTIYVDCDIMEAWREDGDIKVSCNDRVQYANSKFPVLESGENNMVLPTTMQIKIIPRWWIV